MGGSSPSVERFACGSSLFASGAVTVSLYLLASSVRTRGTGGAGRCRGRLLSPRTPIAAAPARARPRRDRARSAGGTGRLSKTFGAALGCVLAPLPMAHALPLCGSSAKWLVGSSDAGARGNPLWVPGRPERSRRDCGAPARRSHPPGRRRAACGGLYVTVLDRATGSRTALGQRRRVRCGAEDMTKDA